jgi:WD40 repeat protein
MNYKKLIIVNLLLFGSIPLSGMNLDSPSIAKELVKKSKQSDLEKGIIQGIHDPEFVESLKNELFEQHSAFFSELANMEVEPVVVSEDTGYLDALAVSPCGKYVAAGSSRGIVHIWTIKQLINTKPANFWYTALVEVGKAWNLRIAESKSFDIHTEHDRNNTTINCLAFSSDGKYLVTGGYDAKVCIINIEAQTVRELLGHKQPVISVAFSPDGKTIATGCRERKVCLWDTESGKCLQSFAAFAPKRSGLLPESRFMLAFLPGEDTLVVSSNGQISLWDAQTGEFLKNIKKGNLVYDIDFNPVDSSILAAAIETYGENDDEPCLLNLKTNDIKRLEGHTDRVTGIEFTPDGTSVATSSYDGTIGLWNSQTGDRLQKIQLDNDNSTCKGWGVAVSPCGKYIVGLSSQTVSLWDAKDGVCVKKFDYAITGKNILFSPCGRYLIARSYKSVILWDIAFLTPELMKKHLSLSELVCLVKFGLFSPEQVLKDSSYKKVYTSLSDSVKKGLSSGYWSDLINY